MFSAGFLIKYVNLPQRPLAK